MWTEIERVIESNQTFVVTSHVNPDGDSIGSALALCEFLKSLGKEAVVMTSDATPMVYQWLDPDGEMIAPATEDDFGTITSADAVFILDVNSWERLGSIGEPIRDATAVKAVIDHHPFRNEITPVTVVDTGACSTAELIFDLITAQGGPMSRRAAIGLYTGILTDTGSFRFANTSPIAHKITSSLLDAGVEPANVYDLVYNQNSEARTRLMGRVLSGISFARNGQVAWLSVSQDMIVGAGASPEDTSGFVDSTMTIAGVEIGIIFVEAPDGRIRISLRSRGNKDVNRVAENLGGGGHRNASGVVFNGTLSDAIPIVTAEAVKAL
ncbi:MAG: bifunctional oligoribonuclease/PAP phosphatase NrnA [Gemmatimonadota bacterium]|nr:bifunctional oligoribonuclease/PAP phosphatase NrnA [Gemmatimonadota bacterium]